MITEEMLKATVDRLNEYNDKDPAAFTALLVNVVPCNEKLMEDESIHVVADEIVRGLDLINALLGVGENAYPRISGVRNYYGLIERFFVANGPSYHHL